MSNTEKYAKAVQTTTVLLQLIAEVYPIYLEARQAGAVSLEKQAELSSIADSMADGSFFKDDAFMQD
jgi:hypothetical protein